MVLLGTETPGTSREIYSEDAEGKTRTLVCRQMQIFLNHCFGA